MDINKNRSAPNYVIEMSRSSCELSIQEICDKILCVILNNYKNTYQ